MRILIFPFVLLLVLLLSGCQTKKLVFVGEDEDWKAKVTVYQTVEYEKHEIQLNYKGNDIQKNEMFSYYVKTSDSGVDFGADNVSLNDNGVYQNTILGSNSPSTSVNDELELKVDWNDKSERFILRIK